MYYTRDRKEAETVGLVRNATILINSVTRNMTCVGGNRQVNSSFVESEKEENKKIATPIAIDRSCVDYKQVGYVDVDNVERAIHFRSH